MNMRTLALAILIAAVPAAAQNTTAPPREVFFEGIKFTCGQSSDVARRFMYATPSAKYLPADEPLPEDPKAASWSIVYRIICEQAYARQTADRYATKEAAAFTRREPVASQCRGHSPSG